MSFYIYENWRAEDKTMIHRGYCRFCNAGMGTGRGTRGETNGMWWGPFETLNEAEQKAKSLGRKRNYMCKMCIK